MQLDSSKQCFYYRTKQPFLRRSQRGAVAVEFILVMPTFIFMCMLILELSLSLVDRHFMKLAAFEAARSYMTETVDNPCAEGQTDAEKDLQNKIRNRAKRAAVIKMAAVSPSVISLAQGLGIDMSSADINQFGQSAGPFAKALAHVLVRLPTAWALTHVKCNFDAIDSAVTVDLTYLRAPEMPFVKHALWAVWVINELNSALASGGLQEALRFDLGQHYFGIYGSSPAIDTMKQRFAELKTKVSSTLSSASSLGVGLHEASTVLKGIPGFSETFGTYFDTAESKYNSVVAAGGTTVTNGLNSIETAINSGAEPIQRAIDDQSNLITGLVYSVPESLRLIPMKTSVRLVRPKVARSDDPWRDAKAFLVGPFTAENPDSTNEEDVKRYRSWKNWAKGMVTQTGEIKTLTE